LVQLRAKFPTEKIPPFPRKHIGIFRSSTSSKIIAERKSLLDSYLNEIITIESIATNQLLLQWLDPRINVNVFFNFFVTPSPNILLQPGQFCLSNPDKAGYLNKEGHVVRNWKKRWFVLVDNMLYYMKTEEVSKIDFFVNN